VSDSRDVIQARLLSNISDEYNKSEGEFMYDAEKPVAIELESAYVKIEGMQDKRFADTATGKDLERIVKEKGLTRKPTIQSYGYVRITGIPGSQITKGELVASESLQFSFIDTTTIPQNGVIDVFVKCTKYGVIGNVSAGTVKFFPKTLTGLQTVVNIEAFTSGQDEETDESLRNRYYAKVNSSNTTANKAQFRSWALDVNGVGNAKVLPLWNGKGTVKVLIVNSEMKAADSTLVSATQNHIDPNMNGDGSGIMPLCGAVCTVDSATEKALNIAVNVLTNLDQSTAESNIKNAINEYLKSIVFKQNYASYSKINDKILNAEGINDCSNLTINGGTSNITLLDTEIAVLGTVVVTLGQ
jgi:uncharacterized phage protein gp47/JayE